jgi:hypothetical protein
MIRWKFTVASAVLTLLFIGTAVLWVRSNSTYDSWSYGGPTGGFCELSSMGGRVCMEWGTTSIPIDGYAHSAQAVEPGMAAPWGGANRLGLRMALNQKQSAYYLLDVDGHTSPAVYSGPPPTVLRSSLFIVPHWSLCLLWAASAAIAFRLSRRSFRPGHCPRCGYDLRASKERCPECGKAISKKARIA